MTTILDDSLSRTGLLASLTWDDGTCTAVYGRTVFGRNPTDESGAVCVAVRDETLTISKTHFEIGADDAGPWIVDRHSFNGTVLVRGGVRRTLVPGLPTSLRPGDRLEFGDRSVAVDAP
ncbi:FHA domain-containing protein [Microbacterium sp. Marseille-Q6648]|jgi:pSer/pThr/pTyr-binding forkhead associated (FHA) protein|uniref:FHA domain-containing protein n=1 Tax=Microbacterium sp. Marseille-Q6648 TaxID=2937991 RepID=UPI00203DF27C|nr:FHA domain-containing protein [Microbacterium sp. Marseille-Q6648]